MLITEIVEIREDQVLTELDWKTIKKGIATGIISLGLLAGAMGSSADATPFKLVDPSNVDQIVKTLKDKYEKGIITKGDLRNSILYYDENTSYQGKLATGNPGASGGLGMGSHEHPENPWLKKWMQNDKLFGTYSEKGGPDVQYMAWFNGAKRLDGKPTISKEQVGWDSPFTKLKIGDTLVKADNLEKQVATAINNLSKNDTSTKTKTEPKAEPKAEPEKQSPEEVERMVKNVIEGGEKFAEIIAKGNIINGARIKVQGQKLVLSDKTLADGKGNGYINWKITGVEKNTRRTIAGTLVIQLKNYKIVKLKWTDIFNDSTSGSYTYGNGDIDIRSYR